MRANKVTQTQFQGLHAKNRELQQERVTWNPDCLASCEPGLPADLDGRRKRRRLEVFCFPCLGLQSKKEGSTT